MHLPEARQLAKELLRRHGLPEWHFHFDRARRRFGCCHLERKFITLSAPLTFLNDADQVRDTILHEIAHALAPGDGHGRKWKAVCQCIGASPKRCYEDAQVNLPPRAPARYRMGCPRCGWWVERHRRTRRKLICRDCRSPVVIHLKAPDSLFATV